MKNYACLIDGQRYENGHWLEIINPETQKVAGQVPALKALDLEKAFKAASEAFKAWSDLKLVERIKHLNMWKNLIIKNQEELADLMVVEIAKGKKASIGEIARSVEYIDYTIGEAMRMHPQAYDGQGWGINNKIAIFEYVPKGIILAISPFNYPVNLSLAKIIPALITGNCVVFKPATQGSLVGMRLCELALEAGLPAGVLNGVTGRGKDIGDLLVANDYINAISFTGSPEVGNHICSLAKKVDLVLELGGKDPAIVLEDADLKSAASKIIKGAFSYSGQRCTAIKRVLVLESVADQLVIYLLEEIKKLSVGLAENNSDITSVIDQKTVKLIQKMIDQSLEQGAKSLIGNKYEGNLMWPTLIDFVEQNMDMARVEPFGPVLPIIRVKSVQQAIEYANDSIYGLQASVFTTNINSSIAIAKKLQTGSVNINDQSQRGPDHFPFLGIKESGLGIQGIKDSLLSFVRPKGIVINWEDKHK